MFTYDDHVGFSTESIRFEAGVWMQRIQANDNLAQDQYGQASFGSLASFLDGQGLHIYGGAIIRLRSAGGRSKGAGFVQDNIKLRPNLELRVGFRFESTNGWNEAHGRASNYLFTDGIIQTDPQIGNSVFTVNRAKFLPEPRVALAWDPFGKGKTVIRTGFGIYRSLLDNLDYRLDQTAPFNAVSL